MSSSKSILIYGPQGSGRYLKTAVIAEYLGMKDYGVIEEFWSGMTLPENTIAFTHDEDIPDAKNFFDLMKEIEANQANTLQADSGL